jgi:Fur family ferric uptake transcriptional regulator/Fur family peroxide stress response transcriptional regulator
MAELESVSLEKMRTFLESKSVKPSYQRLKILEYLIRNRNHPSVDTIFQALCSEIPTLSKTTVYNTLNLFSQRGIAGSLTIVNNELRYDLLKEPHAHFQCMVCNRVLDVPLEDNIFFTDSIDDHRVEEIQVTFKGICKNCLKIDNTLDKIS